MAENLIFPDGSKEDIYSSLIPQLAALLHSETNLIANLANTMSALNMAFGHLWTGCYLVDGKELVLGPFQGPIACTRIKSGRGVCGTAWVEKRTIVVADIRDFKGHISCSSASKSEIVVPILSTDNNVLAVLDIDSKYLNTFDQTDKLYLEKIAALLATMF